MTSGLRERKDGGVPNLIAGEGGEGWGDRRVGGGGERSQCCPFQLLMKRTLIFLRSTVLSFGEPASNLYFVLVNFSFNKIGF